MSSSSIFIEELSTTSPRQHQADSLALIPPTGNHLLHVHVPFQSSYMPPISSSYNDRIRPLLDAIDKLRHLNVTKQGIQLPTIVVVGDQSSGKSSVLESLAGISLPRGQGICTRVPLIMRLKNHQSHTPDISLEFNGKTVASDETRIADAINLATCEIAGSGKGISKEPLTLVVKKKGVPDLTMVDLPGITRVPVHGQPEDIYEQIAEIIMEYIKPEESIILNVLSATVDFPTCESIRMSQQVDRTGERTLAVVTKADKSPEGLLEKVTADDVNIGLGYVCVRNRIGDESYEEARDQEAALFDRHQLLSKIDKSTVGIPILAQKLVQIQARIINKCLPDIVRKINEKLVGNMSELNRMPQKVSTPADAMVAFMAIVCSAKDCLRKLLVSGEYDEYPDDKNMHSTARLFEMVKTLSDELHNCPESDLRRNFLVDEVGVLEETKGIELPIFLPHAAFLAILKRKVEGISGLPVGFVDKVWDYIGEVIMSVLMHQTQNYPQIRSTIRRACHSLVATMKLKSKNWVLEIIEMEKVTDYTCNPEYASERNKFMAQQQKFLDNMWSSGYARVRIEGIEKEVVVDDLRDHYHVLSKAFELKAAMVAYWKVVLRRIVDCVALHLRLSVQNLVNKEMEKEIIKEFKDGGNVERMLEEPPSVAAKREKLNTSIKLLRDSKQVLADIMDRIGSEL